MLNSNHLKNFVNPVWDESIVPTLMEYIRIPNRSPLFDKEWESHGYMEQALQLFVDWAMKNAPNQMQLEILRLPQRTPLIYIEIPGEKPETVLLYGHLDKQPEMSGWDPDLGPWTPVLKGEKLYGRGSADDGYAMFCALTAIKALQLQNIPHGRCVLLIEACEESGSADLPFYLEQLGERLGTPSLIVGLDSGAGNYEQLWGTTSLRGVITANLSVEILQEGVHSGNASGIVPSSFRILRQLLSRIEDEKTGEILLPELHVSIPQERVEQAQYTATVLKDGVYKEFPFIKGATPISNDLAELILNRTWRPALSIVGADDFPPVAIAGNVLRPRSTVKLSMRIPPLCNGKKAADAMKKALEANPPYGSKITCDVDAIAEGWNAPALAPWFKEALASASENYFGQPLAMMGEGGSIPFMAMLGEQFPNAQFLITGVLGPHSNAHGPNEFLHLPTAKKLTGCVAEVLARVP